MGYERHALCALLPELPEQEFIRLRESIKAQGQLEPITIFEGMILDGANRYRACIDLGVEPMTIEYTGDNPLAFILAKNVSRRHLTMGQQAAIVARATDWSRAQTHGGNRRSYQGELVPLETRTQRAAISGASLKTQGMADKVQKLDPELNERVSVGEVALPKAFASVVGREEIQPGKARRERSPSPSRDRSIRLADLREKLEKERIALVRAEEAVQGTLASALRLQSTCEGQDLIHLEQFMAGLRASAATAADLGTDNEMRTRELLALRQRPPVARDCD